MDANRDELPEGPEGLAAEDDDLARTITRLAELDPAEAADPAARIAEALSRALDEEDR